MADSANGLMAPEMGPCRGRAFGGRPRRCGNAKKATAKYSAIFPIWQKKSRAIRHLLLSGTANPNTTRKMCVMAIRQKNFISPPKDGAKWKNPLKNYLSRH